MSPSQSCVPRKDLAHEHGPDTRPASVEMFRRRKTQYLTTPLHRPLTSEASDAPQPTHGMPSRKNHLGDSTGTYFGRSTGTNTSISP